jgi:hypothetical protein
VGHGVLVTEMLKKRRQRGQPVSDTGTDQGPASKIVTPGDHVRSRHGTEFLWALDAGEQHEVLERVFVSTFGVGVADVLEPLNLGRDCGQALELGRG